MIFKSQKKEKRKKKNKEIEKKGTLTDHEFWNPKTATTHCWSRDAYVEMVIVVVVALVLSLNEHNNNNMILNKMSDFHVFTRACMVWGLAS